MWDQTYDPEINKYLQIEIIKVQYSNGPNTIAHEWKKND